jgi:fatty acid synthase
MFLNGGLARKASKGEAKILMTFGGQGQPFMADLEDLFHLDPQARALIEDCAEALVDETSGGFTDTGIDLHSLDLISWLCEPQMRPPDDILMTAPISYPLIFVAQAARLTSLEAVGLPTAEITRWATAATGHSQGIIPAWLAAQALPQEELRQRAAQLARFMYWVGLRKQISWRPFERLTSTMAEVKGLTTEAVELLIDGLDGMVCQIHNGPRRHVVAGPPEQIERLLRRFERLRQCAGGRGRRVTLTPLPCSAPFHSPFMADAVEPLRRDAMRLGIELTPDNLVIPILRYEDGSVWEGDPCLINSLCMGGLDWPATLDAARRQGITHIIDLGPHDGMARLAASIVEGYGIRVVAAATTAGRALLAATDTIQAEPPTPWHRHAPRRTSSSDGRMSSENVFTSRTGRPPVLFMDAAEPPSEAPSQPPQTDDDPAERCLCHRIGNLFDPSFGFAFDALCLDPSWLDLRPGSARMARALRDEGHRIHGVAINIGSRPVEDTIALLKVLDAYQLKLCTLAINDEIHMARALAIADALPEIHLTLHVGSDRWGEQLDGEEISELLLTWYGRIRWRPNLLLMVRSPMATQPYVHELLTGAWSATQGYPPMPVDAVSLDESKALAASAVDLNFSSAPVTAN